MKLLLPLSLLLVGIVILKSSPYDQILKNTIMVSTWRGIGAGIIFDNYYVLTVAHLDGEFFVGGLPARVLKYDILSDLVYLKSSAKLSETKINLAENVDLGEFVYIVGYPLAKKTVFQGTICRIEKDILYIQAPVVFGLSGGGVFNTKNELVGICFAGIGEPNKILLAWSFIKIRKFFEGER